MWHLIPSLPSRGGDRIRTGVQTYSSKAFYMLILFWDFSGSNWKQTTDYFLSCIPDSYRGLSDHHSL
jgi:hypothetical protein